MARDHTAQYLAREEIDLTILVRRLSASITDENWDESSPENAWVKAQNTLQKAKYARSLLKTVCLEEDHHPPRSKQRWNDFRAKLDQVEQFAKEVSERTEPKPRRPAPILPTLPRRPQPSATLQPSSVPDRASTPQPHLRGSEAEPGTDDLLPADPSTSSTLSQPLPMTLIPPTLPSASTSNTTAVSSHRLQSSNALHQELSEQLAQMAIQLRRNATHFSETLARDQAVVEEVQQKLEGNSDVMLKERVRLRDHSAKSGSTTWLVAAIIVVVVFLFMLMIVLIHFT